MRVAQLEDQLRFRTIAMEAATRRTIAAENTFKDDMECLVKEKTGIPVEDLHRLRQESDARAAKVRQLEEQLRSTTVAMEAATRRAVTVPSQEPNKTLKPSKNTLALRRSSVEEALQSSGEEGSDQDMGWSGKEMSAT
jgi:hypothetical protein